MEQKVLIEEHRRLLLEDYIRFLSAERIFDESINRLVDVLIHNRSDGEIVILLQEFFDRTNEIEYRSIMDELIENPDLTSAAKLQFIFKKFFFLIAIAINNLVQEEVKELYNYVDNILLEECTLEGNRNYSFLSKEVIGKLKEILVRDNNGERIQNLFKDISHRLSDAALDTYNAIRSFYFPEAKQRFMKKFLNSRSLSENIFDRINDMWEYLDERIILVIDVNEIAKLSNEEKLQSLFNHGVRFVLLATRHLTLKEFEEFYYQIQIQIQKSTFQSIEVSVPVLLQTQRDDDDIEVFEPHQPQTQHDDI